MDRVPQAGMVSGAFPSPGQLPQISALTDQLNFYWAESQNLHSYVRLLNAQLGDVRRENVRLRQEFAIECQKHARTTAELSQLRTQFRNLDAMLGGQGPQPVSLFFQLEERARSLQQAELNISRSAAALKVTCANIEEQYSQGWQSPSPNFQPSQHRIAPIGSRPDPAELADGDDTKP